jgi:hypothetical protein
MRLANASEHDQVIGSLLLLLLLLPLLLLG